jgi:hypothetical protein
MRLEPRLPADRERLRIRVEVREHVIEVDMRHATTTYCSFLVRERPADAGHRSAASRARQQRHAVDSLSPSR